MGVAFCVFEIRASIIYNYNCFCFPCQELFESVKREEFKVPEGEGGLAETFFNPEREGWLTKEGGKYKSKHRRWFILKEGMLYYFKQASVSVLLWDVHTTTSGWVGTICLAVGLLLEDRSNGTISGVMLVQVDRSMYLCVDVCMYVHVYVVYGECMFLSCLFIMIIVCHRMQIS